MMHKVSLVWKWGGRGGRQYWDQALVIWLISPLYNHSKTCEGLSSCCLQEEQPDSYESMCVLGKLLDLGSIGPTKTGLVCSWVFSGMSLFSYLPCEHRCLSHWLPVARNHLPPPAPLFWCGPHFVRSTFWVEQVGPGSKLWRMIVETWRCRGHTGIGAWMETQWVVDLSAGKSCGNDSKQNVSWEPSCTTEDRGWLEEKGCLVKT